MEIADVCVIVTNPTCAPSNSKVTYMNRRTWLVVIFAFAVSGSLYSAGAFADKNEKESGNVRSVEGVVTDAQEKPVPGAVVYIKNSKTLQIRSFIAKDEGSYYFHSLSPDVDYELHAESNGVSSPNKTLSSFDSRKKAVINLKLK